MAKQKNVLSINKILIILVILITSIQAQKSKSDPNSDLVISPSPVYFGQIPLGSSAVREIILFNYTASNVNISKIEISAGATSDFKIVNNPGSITLGVLEDYTIRVEYTPTTEGELIDLLSITTGSGVSTDSLIANGIPVDGNSITFERILGTTDPDGFGDLYQSSDGGYIIAGSTTPLDANYSDIFVLKTDIFGKALWSNTYGGKETESGVGIAETSDGGYIIASNTTTFGKGGSSIYLVKIDKSGAELWTKVYSGQYEDWGKCLIKTSDGNYLLSGGTNSEENTGRSAYLLKFDESGNEIWSNTYGGNGSGIAAQIIEISDGYVFIGSILSSPENFDFYLVKVDLNGNLLWEKTFGGAQSESGSGVALASDGGFLLCGYTVTYAVGARDAFLVKTSADGTKQWQKAFGFEHNDAFSKVVEMKTGSYLAVGSTVTYLDVNNEYTDGYIVITDKSGNKLTERLIGGDKSDGLSRLHIAKDGKYVIGGVTDSYSKSGDIYFLKLNENGVVTKVDKDEAETIPDKFLLGQNYPNPFNGQTTFNYYIPFASEIDLAVYNVLGRRILSLYKGTIGAGHYTMNLELKDFSSGFYFLSMKAGTKILVRKIMHLK